MTTMPSTHSCKTGLWHRRIQKGDATFFPKLGIAHEKKKIKQFNVEAEGHLRLLKQEFERYFKI